MRGRLASILLSLFLVTLCVPATHAAEPATQVKILQYLEVMAANRSNPDVYLAALQSLKEMGTNAVPTLIEVLGFQPAQADHWYEKAPEAFRARITKTQFLKRLYNEANRGLSDMPETRAYLPSLISLLQDPRKDVRLQTALVLSRHAHKADNSLLLTALPALKDSESEIRNTMIRVFSSATGLPPVKTALEETLQDSNEGVRSNAAYTLLMMAERDHAAALATLRSLFSSTNIHTRYAAAHYYTISSPTNLRLETQLIPIYTNALSVGDTNLQARAMTSLSRYGRRVQYLVPELQKFLSSPHLSVREAATNALKDISPEILPGKPADPASREIVLQHLEAFYSTNQHVVFRDIKAMGTNAVPLLIEVMGYQTTQADQWYEKAYAKAPTSIQNRMSKPEALEKLRDQVSLLLLNMPETHLYMTNLFALLQDQRPEVRRHSASLISHHMRNRGQHMEDAVMLECLPSLKDSDALVRRYIAHAFASKGAALPRVKIALEAVLNDPVEEVRMAVAHALLQADGNHAGALQALKQLFTSTSAHTRYFAAAYYVSGDLSNSRLEDEVLTIFINTVSGPDTNLHQAASYAVSRFGPRAKAAVPALSKHLQSTDPELQKAARESLERIAPEVLPAKKP